MKTWQEYTGFEWLLIDAASRYGMDKEHFSARITWAAKTLLPLIVAAETEEQMNAFLSPYIIKADEKPMFCGAILAIFDTVKSRESSWQVGQDAASSGPQLLSVLLKDKIGMRNTGVLGTDVPDLYTAVTKVMDTTGVHISRKIVKKGIIPHVYASEAEPKKVFGKAYSRFLKAYKAVVPKAQEASDFMVAAWNSHATEHVFIMPDGAIVRIPVLVQQKKTLPLGKRTFEFIYDEIGSVKRGERGTKSLSANTTHAYDAYVLRELNRRCNYDPVLIKRCIKLLKSRVQVDIPEDMTEDKLLGLQALATKFNQGSAVAYEYIDEANVHWIDEDYAELLQGMAEAMLDDEPFEVTNIHDEFKTLPDDVGVMKMNYNVMLIETYMGNWWVETAKTLTGMDVAMMANKVDTNVLVEMSQAAYAIG